MSQVLDPVAANVPSLAVKIVTGVDRFNILIGKAVAWLIIPMMLCLIWEVFMRYCFQAPTIWVMDIVVMLFGIHFMLGSPYTLQAGQHIRTDFLYTHWSVKKRAVVDMFSYFVLFFPAHLVFFYISCGYAYKSFTQNEVSVISPWMPIIWPVKMAIPICVGLSLIQAVSEVTKCWYRYKTGLDLWATEVAEVG